MGYEHFFFGKDYASYSISEFGNRIAVEFSQILMAVWAINAVPIAVDGQIERSFVLNDSLIERRKKHEVVVVHFFDGDDEQAVLLSRVASGNRRAMICSGHVCSENFFWKRLVEVD